MMHKMNWGVIGCGGVTEVKSVPAYKLVEGFDVIAVMRRNQEKGLDYAKRHNIKTFYANADELINDENIDAIYIATPPDSHKFYALKVAQANKTCCIEKPLSSNYNDSLAIKTAFETKRLPLFVAYYRRSLPRFLKVKEWLDKGLIGTVRSINWNFSKPTNDLDVSGTYNWRTDPKIARGGYFDDLASHGLDLFTFLLGNINDVNGICTNQQNLYKAYDAISASWIHKNGITGAGSWNFGCHTRVDKVMILGSKGEIYFSVFGEQPITLKNTTNTLDLFIENPKHIQQYHVENMKRDLFEHDYFHPSTGDSALHTCWIMNKILE